MTYKELKCEVEALGFDESISNERDLAIFANRALRRIFTDRGVSTTVKLYVRDSRPNIIAENITYEGKELVFNLTGGAYSVEVSGEGSFTVKCGEDIHEREFNTDGSCFKDFIKGNTSVTFSGRHSYLIKRIATFPHAYGADTDAIPDADGRVNINVAKSLGNFICFTGLPTDKGGSPVVPISMENGVITLPDSFIGEIFVTYLRLPREIYESSPDEKIDIGDEVAHLLPLLCASYVYLEYDSELSKHYSELYEKELRTVKTMSQRQLCTSYVDVLGWA